MYFCGANLIASSILPRRLKETKFRKAYLICEPLWLGAFVVNFSIIK
jgi:hypothetical protein